MRNSFRRSLLAAAIVGASFGGVAATQAQDEPTQQPTVTTVTPSPAPTPKCAVSVRTHNRAVRRFVRFSDYGGNYVAKPITKKQIWRLGQMRKCAVDAQSHRKMVHYWHVRKANWNFHKEIDAITPYGEWAIPPYIVMCESGGDYTEWNHGGSGASGAYQIMGQTWYAYGGGRYASAAAYAPPYAQHIVASRIWHGGGASQWSCS